ncbi:MAG: hypothetical protein AAGG07_07600 [Planctomycetota bacterium]
MKFRLTGTMDSTDIREDDVAGRIRPDAGTRGLARPSYRPGRDTDEVRVDTGAFDEAFDRLKRGLDDLSEEIDRFDDELAPIRFRRPEDDDDGPRAA